MHMLDTMQFHPCGGTILHSGGRGEHDHSYCDRCHAFAYDEDGASQPVPSGIDERTNRAAWDEGEECSPDA